MAKNEKNSAASQAADNVANVFSSYWTPLKHEDMLEQTRRLKLHMANFSNHLHQDKISDLESVITERSRAYKAGIGFGIAMVYCGVLAAVGSSSNPDSVMDSSFDLGNALATAAGSIGVFSGVINIVRNAALYSDTVHCRSEIYSAKKTYIRKPVRVILPKNQG
jgi:hypothetical protein